MNFANMKISAAVTLVFFLASISSKGFGAEQNVGRVANVEFNDIFVRQFDAKAADISRFNVDRGPAPGRYAADIYLNNDWIGRNEVELREQSDKSGQAYPCLTREQLDLIGIDWGKTTSSETDRKQSDACWHIDNLISGAKASFDPGEQRIDVAIPQADLNRKARGYVDPREWDEGVPAIILAYQANAFKLIGVADSSPQAYLGLNGGINLGAWRFRHVGGLTYGSGVASGAHYQSQLTFVRRNLPDIKSQVSFGENFTDGTVFDGFGLRGALLNSDELMYPQSERGYAPVVHGFANSSAHVQIRQNGATIYDTTVPPGPFEISDLFPTALGGNLDVVVTEANGSVHTTMVPFAAVPDALRPNAMRYSMAIGQYNAIGINYKPFVMEGVIRYGFNNFITGYGGIILSREYFSGSVGAALNSAIGAVSFDVTHASAREPVDSGGRRSTNGVSLHVAYSKLFATQTNLLLAAYRYSSPGFVTLPTLAQMYALGSQLVSSPRDQYQISVNQNLPQKYGSVYLTGVSKNYWGSSGGATTLSAGYSNVWQGIGYNIAFSRSLNATLGRWDNRLMLTFTVPLNLGKNISSVATTLSQSSVSGNLVQSTFSGTIGDDHPLSYGVSGLYSGSSYNGASRALAATASYVSPWTTVSGNVARSADYTQVGGSVTGTLVAYSGGIVGGPLMADTVAIVEAKGAGGASVGGGGSYVDRWGHALVPSVMPYSINQIVLDPKGLPLDIQLQSTMQNVVPTEGAIVIARFGTKEMGPALFIKGILENGRPLPFGAEIKNAGGEELGSVGQFGNVVIRAPKDQWKNLVASWGNNIDQSCRLRLMPRSEFADEDKHFVRVNAICGDDGASK